MLQTLICRADVAQKYGLDGAVFLHNIVYWTQKNRAENRHFHKGRYWTYASRKGLAKMYPLWSDSQIKRIIAKLREADALLVDDFNENRMNRTSWYSPSDEILRIYGEELPSADPEPPPADPEPPPADPDLSPAEPDGNDPMHCPESPSALGGIGQCLYNDNKVIPQEVPPIAPQGGRRKGARKDKSIPKWKPERFEAFWNYYRDHVRGEDRQGAAKSWDKLKPDDELIAEMGRALKRQIASESWQAGVGIPYAKTWLNNRRWTDSLKPPASGGSDGGLVEEDGVTYIDE